MKKKTFDFIIAGSGFAGSIAALVLAKNGFDVCLIEKKTHPRFAIGESSTPIADMILRSLADRHDLPFLHQLSRYGSWQKHHPKLLCGIKRGFSYYFHSCDKMQEGVQAGIPDVLVAASQNDTDSDTNWYRPDIDHFLVQKAGEYGVHYLDNTQIVHTKHSKQGEFIHCDIHKDNKQVGIRSRWIIDATGTADFVEKHFGVESDSSAFHTHSCALFSHFHGVPRWKDFLVSQSPDKSHYPYDPDHSALHHLIDEGWIWNLRFLNDLLSAGIVFDLNSTLPFDLNNSNKLLWDNVLKKYPPLHLLFNNASLSDNPGKIIRSGRLQRRMHRIFGKNWVSLNHSAGFVDPLHSTGIAHTLCGLERLLQIFLEDFSSANSLKIRLHEHQKLLFNEFELIDLLVSGCYLARKNYDLFHAYTMVYFACAIAYEQKRLQGITPESYLCADDPRINRMVQTCYSQLRSYLVKQPEETTVLDYTDLVRNKIKPWNIAGLLDPEKSGIYEHTAVELDT